MASTGKSTVIYIQVLLALAVVLLLAACVAGRGSNGLGLLAVSTPSQTPLQCSSVQAVQTGDTCFDIAKQAGVNTKQFLAINPNLVCDHLFVGQWVCVHA